MYDFLKRTWANINLDSLSHNFKEIKEIVGCETKVMCVVKADAYGHGAEYVAKELQEQGADWFAVSNLEEAIQLRNCGIDRSILVLGYTPYDMAEKLCNFNISQAILSYDYGMHLSRICKLKGVKVKGHIKIDTGMNRIGFSCQSTEEINESVELIKKIYDFGQINFEGIFTHFAVSDSIKNGKDFTNIQFERFNQTIKMLKDAKVNVGLRHCCNSAGIISHPYMKLDMVRAGVMLYGLPPSEELQGKIDLHPLMELKTVISQIKTIKKGRSVSYGRTYTAKTDMKVATVPIGYADGYSRNFSGKASMLVCGKKAPVIGKVCMDQLVLDVTDIDDAREGTEVTVFGGQISINELAKVIDTINYEVVCLIGKRVPRVYYRFGGRVGKSSLYI